MTAAERYNQRLVELGFSQDRRHLYIHEINNWQTAEKAFAVASEGLMLSAEDKTFALERLATEYPCVDPYSVR